MSQKFGLSYIFYLECQFQICTGGGGFTFEDLCKWNGNVPPKFFDKFK